MSMVFPVSIFIWSIRNSSLLFYYSIWWLTVKSDMDDASDIVDDAIVLLMDDFLD